MDLAGELAAGLLERAGTGLADDVARESRRALINVLGTAIGASTSGEVDAMVSAGRGLGHPESGIPGRTERLSRLAAAAAAGLAGHRDDFDDTHPVNLIHAGASTLATVYPLAGLDGYDAERGLLAFALGLETQFRVGQAMTPTHYDAGWHITGTCGVIGDTVAAGVLAGHDVAELRAAILLAANMPLGHREGFGTPIKPFHAGYAASNGILAAELARAGFPVGNATGLEEAGGYFEALGGTLDPSWLERSSVAAGWLLFENTYKAFPCGVVAHPGIDAAITLHQETGLTLSSADQVSSITLHCNPMVLELMGRPTAANGLDARFCAVHGVAVGLLVGRAGVAEFSDERATDPAVETLRSRTTLVPSDAILLDSCRLVVERGDGAHFERAVEGMAGSSRRPLSDAQLGAKFTALVEPVLPGRSSDIIAVVRALGTSASMLDLAQAVSGA